MGDRHQKQTHCSRWSQSWPLESFWQEQKGILQKEKEKQGQTEKESEIQKGIQKEEGSPRQALHRPQHGQRRSQALPLETLWQEQDGILRTGKDQQEAEQKQRLTEKGTRKEKASLIPVSYTHLTLPTICSV